MTPGREGRDAGMAVTVMTMPDEAPTTRRALLVVDAQRDVMAASIRRDEVVGNIGILVATARGAGVPVVWIRHSSEELQLGSPGWQLVEELVPLPGEVLVEKRWSDAFAQTDLAEQLTRLGAGAVVLCGAQTDACVRNTFYGALYRGFPVTVVTDAHTTEDLRRWGAVFTPEQSIGVLNLQAQSTVLPGVCSSVTTTALAFS